MAGNDPSTAIDLGSATGGSQNFNNGSDTDSSWWYKLDLVGGMRYRIWIHPAAPGAPSSVFLGYPANASVSGSKIYADDAGGSTYGTQLNQIFGSTNPLFRDAPSDETIWILAHSTTAGIGQVRWESWVVDPDSPDEYNEAVLITGSTGSHAWDFYGEWRYYFKIVPDAGETLALSMTDVLWDENTYFEVYAGEDESTATYYDWGGWDSPVPHVPLITGDGTTVYVIMIYYFRNSGGGVFSWNPVDIPDAGPNNDFASATVLDVSTGGTVAYDNTGATKEPSLGSLDDNRSIWYKLNVPADGAMVLFNATPGESSTDGSTDPTIRVIKWTTDPSQRQYLSNNGAVIYALSNYPAGTEFYARLAFPDGDQLNWSTGVLTWTAAAPPSNVTVDTAVQLGGSAHLNTNFPIGLVLYYRIVANTDGLLTVAITGPGTPYYSYVFLSSPSFPGSLGSAQARPTDNPGAPISAQKSAIRRKVHTGEVYYVQVSGVATTDLQWGIQPTVTWDAFQDTPPESDNEGATFGTDPIWGTTIYQGASYPLQSQSKYELQDPEITWAGEPPALAAEWASALAEAGYPADAISSSGATVNKSYGAGTASTLSSSTGASMMWHGENGGDIRVEWSRTAFGASQFRIDPNPTDPGDGGFLDAPAQRAMKWQPFVKFHYNTETEENEDVIGAFDWVHDNYGYAIESDYNLMQLYENVLEQQWSSPKGSLTPWSVNVYAKIGTVSHTRRKGSWGGYDHVDPLAMAPGAPPPTIEIRTANYDNIAVSTIPWDGESETILQNTITLPATVDSSTVYDNVLLWYEDYKGLLSETIPGLLMRLNVTPTDVSILDGLSQPAFFFGVYTVEYSISAQMSMLWALGTEYPDQMRWGYYAELFYPFEVLTIGVPGAVPNVVAIALGNGDVVLTWDPPYWDGGYPIEGYIITPYLNGIALDPIWVYGPDTGLIITGLEWGDQYLFTIIAYNAIGRGGLYGPSNLVTVGSPDNLPPFFPEHPLEVKLGEALWRKLGNENATYYGRIKIKIQDVAKWHQEYRVGDGPIVAYETHPLRMWNGLRWVTVTRMIGAKYTRPAP